MAWTTNFLVNEFSNGRPRFSPNGRWIAYQSSERGTSKSEIYVQPYPNGGQEVRVSIGGRRCIEPIWSRTSNELLFATQKEDDSNELQIYVANYEEEDETFTPIGDPDLWPGGRIHNAGWTSYDLHPDGQRLLVRRLADVEGDENQSHEKVVLFQHFDEWLRQNVPATTR
jgi:Tol biopolymer transport system component